MNPIPAVGQLWESTNPRDQDVMTGYRRRMEVVAIADPYAFLRNVKTGRLTRISFYRLTYSLGGRGYRFIASSMRVKP